MNPKTFAIDYDGTWSADPEAFRGFATMLRSRGHRVLLITARVSGHHEVVSATSGCVDMVLFSGADYKREYAAKFGESVDIWIDDNPGMIGPDIPLIGVVPDRLNAYVSAAAKSYSTESQLRQLQEEAAELIVEVSHVCRRPGSAEDLDRMAKEIADVELMLAAVKHTLGITSQIDASLDRAEAELATRGAI